MIAVCLLTLNAGAYVDRWIAALAAQNRQPDRVLVMDSTSSDNTVGAVQAAGYEVKSVKRSEFGHGRTRQAALNCLDNCDVVVFMTQDAILAEPDSLAAMIAAFDDPAVDVAYGRQLPHGDASLIASHARAYNYPPQSEIRKLLPGTRPGLQVAFCSDSYAAYRVRALQADGGFPLSAMYAEDMIVAARCLIRGGSIAYVAAACVYHSHNYSVWQEFQRYFDTGVFHHRNPWLTERLGRAEGHGAAFVVSELRCVLRRAPWRIFEVCLRVLTRYSGYRAGLAEYRWPMVLKRRWSMVRQF